MLLESFKRLTGKDVPIIDPKNEGKSLKDNYEINANKGF